MRTFVRQEARSGGLPENLTLPTAIEGVYISCKFDVDIPKGYGDIAPRILAEKNESEPEIKQFRFRKISSESSSEEAII